MDQVKRFRLLLGISVFWLGLSLLFDGLTVLVLPATIAGLVPEEAQASAVGVITFAGLFAAMLVQPAAGRASDLLHARLGRRGFVGLAVVGILAGLFVFGAGTTAIVVALGYVLVQVAGSSAQAAQQGFIPDLVPARWRGRAAGIKGAMDVGGAFLAFLVLASLLEEGGRTSAVGVMAAVIVAAFVLTVLLVREGRTADALPTVRGDIAGDGPRAAGLGSFAVYRFDRARHPEFAWLLVSRFLFLLGTYAIGRFFLFFVAERLGLGADAAVMEAGALLATLTLVTAVAAVPAGWAADRYGRPRLMVAGALVSAVGAVLLVVAGGAAGILLFGGLLSIGSAAFTSANWAATADAVPHSEAGRYMGIANFGTAGAAAAAGLAGPVVDLANRVSPGAGYPALFVGAAVAFLASAVAVRALTAAAGTQAPLPTRPVLAHADEELR